MMPCFDLSGTCSLALNCSMSNHSTSYRRSENIMHTVRQLLKNKGSQVWSISPQAPIYEALELMAEKRIGAVTVMEKDRLVGIFSERDYARKVILKGRSSKVALIGELMTSKLYCVALNDTVDTCMALMTNKRIRHLPVLENDQLLGIVTIGDVVKQVISGQETTIRELEKYIMGDY
jgi:CBS domain-containing protein